MASENTEDPQLQTQETEEKIQTDYIATNLPKPSAINAVFGKGKVLASNWMGALTRQLTLNEVVMLGSHDSAAFKGKHQFQVSTIKEQLKFGVRFLDFQLASHENDVWLYYGVACEVLGNALMEIESFVTDNPTEKVIVVLRNSKTAPNPVVWSDVKKLFEIGFSSKLVAKEHAGVKIGEMKGSVILIAPEELEMEKNWGSESIIHYAAPDTTNTLLGLHDYLQEMTYGELDKKQAKLVWVECRSRDEANVRKNSEVKEAQHPAFLDNSEQLHFNILSFSFIDRNHFSLVRDYFLKWQ